jgi:maltose O-acetyltransferase
MALLARGLGSIANVMSVARAALVLRQPQLARAGVRLWGSVVLKNSGQLHIGRKTRLVGTVTPLEIVVGEHGVLAVGEQVFINYGTSIGALKHVTIGSATNIGSYVIIIDNNFHHIDPERRLEVPESAPVTIGTNVWLGSRVTVLPGTTIGDHSVIGAGSVVSGTIPARVLAAGIPARVIREI